MQVHGSFLGNWDVAQNVTLTRNGDEYLWYGVFDVAEAGEFGVKNYGTEAWFAAPDGANIQVEPGHYMIFVRLTEDNQLAEPILWGEPAYYVVGTCGNKGWAADANADNTAYAMQAQEDGTYALAVTFTEDDTDTWTGRPGGLQGRLRPGRPGRQRLLVRRCRRQQHHGRARRIYHCFRPGDRGRDGGIKRCAGA